MLSTVGAASHLICLYCYFLGGRAGWCWGTRKPALLDLPEGPLQSLLPVGSGSPHLSFEVWLGDKKPGQEAPEASPHLHTYGDKRFTTAPVPCSDLFPEPLLSL